MSFSGMSRRVSLERPEVSDECTTSIKLMFLRSVFQLLVTANVVLRSLILFALMMEAIPV
jgi:hypothetical protein